MIRILLTYFWPVLVPLALYLIWYIRARKKTVETDTPIRWMDGPWYRTLLACLCIAILCFMVVMLTHVNRKADHYKPARYENGKLLPAEVR